LRWVKAEVLGQSMFHIRSWVATKDSVLNGW